MTTATLMQQILLFCFAIQGGFVLHEYMQGGSRNAIISSSPLSSSFSSSRSLLQPKQIDAPFHICQTEPKSFNHQQQQQQQQQQQLLLGRDENGYDDDDPMIQVVLWPEGRHHSEFIHVYEDGIDQSAYLTRSHNLSNLFLVDEYNKHDNSNKHGNSNSSSSNDDTISPSSPSIIHQTNMVWVGIAYAGDGTYGSFSEWCDEYETLIRNAQEERYNQGLPRCCWHIYIIDYTDHPTNNMSCPGIEDAMNVGNNNNIEQQFVHYAQRSIVVGRHWNAKTQWIDPGKRIQNIISVSNSSDIQKAAQLPPHHHHHHRHRHRHRNRHMNYPVRTDIVRTLQRRLKRKYRGTKLSDPIESCCFDRPVDVAHFSPLDTSNTSIVYQKPYYPKFRHRVSSILEDYCINHNYTSFIGTAGRQNEQGRRKVKNPYIDKMLESKIIVLSQRDEWEDHYRLMEAMVSGAMIMNDRMISLPDGYQDGISIVEYESASDLLEKLTYYLDPEHASERQSIAREGRTLAMTRHRSWHRMEELIFDGRIRTQCSNSDDGRKNGNITTSRSSSSNNACPFVVNALD